MSINRICLLGNVGADPEVRELDGGVKVATFRLATTERSYVKKDGSQIPERTEWHNIVLWRGLADIADKYIRKGSKLYIEGPLRTRSYESNGIKKNIAEVYADNIELLGSQQPTQSQQAAPMPTSSAPVYNQQRTQSYQPQQPQQDFGNYPTVDELPPFFNR